MKNVTYPCVQSHAAFPSGILFWGWGFVLIRPLFKNGTFEATHEASLLYKRSTKPSDQEIAVGFLLLPQSLVRNPQANIKVKCVINSCL